MPQGWGLRISHHFSGGVYWEILLRIISRTVSAKEILDHPRRWRRKEEKAGMCDLLKERPELGFRRVPWLQLLYPKDLESHEPGLSQGNILAIPTIHGWCELIKIKVLHICKTQVICLWRKRMLSSHLHRYWFKFVWLPLHWLKL